MSRTPRFLTVDEVIDLHRELIQRFGGSLGVRDAGLLDSAVHAAQSSYGGQFLYPDLLDKAAIYLLHLASNHPFVDDNKQVGWSACRAFLLLNGVRLRPRAKDAVAFVLKVAAGEVRDWRTVSRWLGRHAKVVHEPRQTAR